MSEPSAMPGWVYLTALAVVAAGNLITHYVHGTAGLALIYGTVLVILVGEVWASERSAVYVLAREISGLLKWTVIVLILLGVWVHVF